MFRLCIWHILERGLGSKLEPLVGVGPTTAFKLEVWATARASDGDFGVARGRTIALPSTVHQLFGSPTIPDSHKQWSPGAISARVAREARAVGFTWTDLPPTSVEPSASDGALPSAAASAPEPVRRGRGKRGAATVAKPSPSARVTRRASRAGQGWRFDVVLSRWTPRRACSTPEMTCCGRRASQSPIAMVLSHGYCPKGPNAVDPKTRPQEPLRMRRVRVRARLRLWVGHQTE